VRNSRFKVRCGRTAVHRSNVTRVLDAASRLDLHDDGRVCIPHVEGRLPPWCPVVVAWEKRKRRIRALSKRRKTGGSHRISSLLSALGLVTQKCVSDSHC
jgi:hypothetical protein